MTRRHVTKDIICAVCGQEIDSFQNIVYVHETCVTKPWEGIGWSTLQNGSRKQRRN